jgi:hypothetical protein
MQTKSAFPECEHIKSNGIRCGSPAMRGAKLCFFHHPAAREAHRLKQLTLRPHPAKAAIRDFAEQWPARPTKDQRALLTYAFNLMTSLDPLSAAEEIAAQQHRQTQFPRVESAHEQARISGRSMG